jgi:hypothetical protein
MEGVLHEASKVFEEKTSACFVKDAKTNLERPLCAANSKRSSERDNKKNLESSEVEDYDSEVLQKLGEYITVMSNPARIRMLGYCLKERSFTDIMLALRLNPASLKHHVDLLQIGRFIEKTGTGKGTRYRTTDFGKTMLDFVGEVLSVVKAT